MPLLSLMLGVFACSTSVLWIKWSAVDPVLLTGLRLGLAAVFLAPLAARDWRRHRDALRWSHLRDASVPGVVLAIHFMTWIVGARMSPSSNATLVVNMSPLATPFTLAVLMGERVTRRELIATGVATLGLVILFVDDYRLSHQTLRGDLICFGSMLVLAIYLALGRKFRHHPTNTLFVTPVFAVAALTAFAAAPVAATGFTIDWVAEAPWVLALTVIPTIIGHSLILGAMRHFRGQVVAVVCMTQFVFATALGWLMLGETPSVAFFPVAALIMLAGGIIAWGHRGSDGNSPALPQRGS